MRWSKSSQACGHLTDMSCTLCIPLTHFMKVTITSTELSILRKCNLYKDQHLWHGLDDSWGTVIQGLASTERIRFISKIYIVFLTLMSRCATFIEWRYMRPSRIWRISLFTCLSSGTSSLSSSICSSPPEALQTNTKSNATVSLLQEKCTENT